MPSPFKLLVVGGSSFVGKNLIAGAPNEWKIFATYNRDSSFPEYARGFSNVACIKCDLADERSVGKLGIREADAVIYLAANSNPRLSITDPVNDLKVNALGVMLLLEKLNCKRFVYISSGGVYLDSDLPYLFSKRAAESYVRFYSGKKGFSYAIIRLFETYGPYNPERKITRKLVTQFDAGNGDVVLYGDGKNLIDTLYIEDTVKALIKVIWSQKSATADLCTGRSISIRELVTRTATVFGITPKISYSGNAVEDIHFSGNPGQMERVFGFKPTISLEEGIRKWRQFKEINGKF